MTAPEAKLEYRIERDGEKFVAIDPDEEIRWGVRQRRGSTGWDRAREERTPFGRQPFSAAHFFWALLRAKFLRPAPSRLLLRRFLPRNLRKATEDFLCPSRNAVARFGSSGLSLLGAPEKWGRKRRHFHVLLELGFVNCVLSVATQRSWKNARDEWSSKVEWHPVVVFRPQLAERVAQAVGKGAYVLVEGSLVSSVNEPSNGKGKKSKGAKTISWSIRADVVRRLDRDEPQPEAAASAAEAQAAEGAGELSY